MIITFLDRNPEKDASPYGGGHEPNETKRNEGSNKLSSLQSSSPSVHSPPLLGGLLLLESAFQGGAEKSPRAHRRWRAGSRTRSGPRGTRAASSRSRPTHARRRTPTPARPSTRRDRCMMRRRQPPRRRRTRSRSSRTPAHAPRGKRAGASCCHCCCCCCGCRCPHLQSRSLRLHDGPCARGPPQRRPRERARR